MPKIISIDLGYRNVKGVNSEGTEIMFPSVVAPYVKHPLEETMEGVTQIKYASGATSQYFYGDRAIIDGDISEFTLDRVKHVHHSHDILMFTAARKLDYKSGDTLVVGVPIAYREQKAELKARLERIHASISVDNGPVERISFSNVHILTQGVVTFSLIPDLPKGILISIDGGEKTTDVSTVENNGGILKPIVSKCFSLELGYNRVIESVRNTFQSITGSPVSDSQAREIERSNGIFVYKGEALNLSKTVEEIRLNLARAIIDRTNQRLGETVNFISGLYLAGGCAQILPFKSVVPNAKIINEPQMANARAYLEIIKSMSVQ